MRLLILLLLMFPFLVQAAYTEQQKKILVDLRAGNIESIRQGLDSGVDVNFSIHTGITLLHRAVRYIDGAARLQQALEVVSFLLEQGAEPNAQVHRSRFTSLHYHLNGNYISLEVLRSLIEADADVNKTDAHKQVPLHLLASDNRRHILGVEKLSYPWSSDAADSYYGSEGERAIIRLFLKAGADINATDAYDFTPLHRAAESRYVYFINGLVGVPEVDVRATNMNGQTAFHLVRDVDTLKALQNLLMEQLKSQMELMSDSELALTLFVERFEDRVSTAVGRDKVEALFNREMTGTEMVELQESIFEMQVKDVIDIPDKFGKTVLHYRARWGDAESVKLLLEAGSDVNARDKAGVTALHEVVSFELENLGTVEELVKAGADILAENDNKRTPLDIARDNRHEATVRFFKESLSASKEKASEGERKNSCHF